MQEVQRGKQLAERAQSTSKLLREDVTRGPRRASRAGGAAADAGEDPLGVTSLTKRLEDYAGAFDQISTATGAMHCLWHQHSSGRKCTDPGDHKAA